jgi:hypothetical protein
VAAGTAVTGTDVVAAVVVGGGLSLVSPLTDVGTVTGAPGEASVSRRSTPSTAGRSLEAVAVVRVPIPRPTRAPPTAAIFQVGRLMVIVISLVRPAVRAD